MHTVNTFPAQLGTTGKVTISQLRTWIADDPEEVTDAHGETLIRPKLDPHTVEVIFHRSLHAFALKEDEVILEPTTSNKPMSCSRQESAGNRNQIIVKNGVLVVICRTRLKLALQHSPDFLLFTRVIDEVLWSILQVNALMADGSRFKMVYHQPQVVKRDG